MNIKKKLKRIAVVGAIITGLMAESTACALTASYISMGAPNIDSTFKTWMDYRAITNTSSPQYQLVNTWGWCDRDGFMRCNGERDLGITDDYYIIALGSYYGTNIGTKYRITTDESTFYGILGDCKDDRHTNSTHQYAHNNDVVEFLVYTPALNPTVKQTGSANSLSTVRGNVVLIERIDFY